MAHGVDVSQFIEPHPLGEQKKNLQFFFHHHKQHCKKQPCNAFLWASALIFIGFLEIDLLVKDINI